MQIMSAGAAWGHCLSCPRRSKSGQNSGRLFRCPLCAKSGLVHCSKQHVIRS